MADMSREAWRAVARGFFEPQSDLSRKNANHMRLAAMIGGGILLGLQANRFPRHMHRPDHHRNAQMVASMDTSISDDAP